MDKKDLLVEVVHQPNYTPSRSVSGNNSFSDQSPTDLSRDNSFYQPSRSLPRNNSFNSTVVLGNNHTPKNGPATDIPPIMGFESQELIYKHLSAYLKKNLDKKKYTVIPLHESELSKVQTPAGLKVQSAGTVMLSSDNSSPVLGYKEFIDKDSKISLIQNEIFININPVNLNEILSKQLSYIQDIEKINKLSDHFVFRLEFKSPQHFEEYQKNGNLEKLLADFAKSNPEFEIKVVFTDVKTADKKYDSFQDLFAGKESQLKPSSPPQRLVPPISARLHQTSYSSSKP